MSTTTQAEHTTEPDVDPIIADPVDEALVDADGTEVPQPTADHHEVSDMGQWQAAVEDPDIAYVRIADSAAFADQSLTIPAGMNVSVDGTSRVGAVQGEGIVTLAGRARVGEVGGDVAVASMAGRSRIDVLTGNGHVVDLTDRAKIRTVTGNATVSAAREHGRIGEVTGAARIVYLHAPAKIGMVNGNARIEGRDAAARVGPVADSAYVAPRSRVNPRKDLARSRPGPQLGRAATNTSRSAHRFVRGEIDRELAIGRTLAAEAEQHSVSH